mgnify:CR=1 FL=1
MMMCDNTISANHNQQAMKEEDTQRMLEEFKSFTLQTLRNAGHRSHWDFLSPTLQADRDIALVAFIHDQVNLEELPESFRNNRPFFLDAVKKRSRCWFRLPDSMLSDPEFPRNFYKFNGDDLVTCIFEEMPFLCQEPGIWTTIISSIFSSTLACSVKTIESWAPPEILSNEELWQKACIKDQRALTLVNDSLALDKEFLEKLLQKKPEALAYVSTDALRQFPFLLKTHLESFFNSVGAYSLKERLLEHIPQEFYAKTWFIKTWLTTGGAFEHDFFPTRLRNNPKTCLLYTSDAADE